MAVVSTFDAADDRLRRWIAAIAASSLSPAPGAALPPASPTTAITTASGNGGRR